MTQPTQAGVREAFEERARELFISNGGKHSSNVATAWELFKEFSALTSAGDGWQDIATAPTDWTPVDLWVVSRYQPQGHRETCCRARLSNGAPDWQYECPEMGWRRVDGEPTHWRPLPSAPAAFDGGK